MIREPNLNSFALKERVEEMIVYNDITMKDIYEKYKKFLENENDKNLEEIRFFNYDKNYFCFQIGDIYGYDILTEPIEIKINERKIDIICDEQIEFIQKKYKVDSIFCKDDKTKNDDFVLFNLFNHIGHDISIYSSENYSIFKNQKEIDIFLQTYKMEFINKVFKTPQEFEKNFEYYFNLNKKCINDTTFTIFEDFNNHWRFFVSLEINKWKFGICYNFYGSSGTGKSITLIGALKYGQKYPKLGTFYINCKTLRVLNQQYRKIEMKQILIDELVFLLRNKYDDYIKCCEMVKNFSFDNKYNFWKLIENILEYVNNIEDYYFIIAFDQYNNENDTERKLDEIKSKYLGNKKFKIIVFPSMNEKDIRDIKQNALLYDDVKIKDEKNRIIEINNICSIFPLEFNTKKLEVFYLLGKTMKAYHEIEHHKLSLDSPDKYLTEKKEKIKFKLLCFYKKIEEKKELYYGYNFEIDINNCIRDILSFIPNEEYTKKELVNIIDKVHFKFFEIGQTVNGKYIIKFSYPLIEQIFIDIYKLFLQNYKFRYIKTITKNSKAFEYIFIYAVIFNIIEKSKSEKNTIFNYFHITKNLKVKKFILKDNEKFENLIFEKQNLDINYDYIIEQEAFCDKTLDFILIHFINSEPYVYGFQVSIYLEKIHDSNELEYSYETMRALLKRYFNIDFKKEHLFFGYIFNYEEIKTDKYSDMLSKCDSKSLKYCFYEPYQEKFFDSKGNEIQNINDITIKVFKKITQSNANMDELIYYPLTINYPDITIKMNHEQYNSLSDLVKKIFNLNAKWKIIKKTEHNNYYQSYNNWRKYFFFYHDGTYLKATFFYNRVQMYKILLTGEIEEDFDLDSRPEIYICEVYA